ncbi:hypothetical protein EBESD8_41680 [Rhodococcus aetherivorans]|nr:hypothetical protein EBESD8_41680 [Rhodococcus aetherivorans]
MGIGSVNLCISCLEYSTNRGTTATDPVSPAITMAGRPTPRQGTLFPGCSSRRLSK